MGAWLRRLLLGRKGVPADLLTGVVGPHQDGGWYVTWVGEGIEPKELRAWTLTQVLDDAVAAVIDLYANFPRVSNPEVQFAIYPWDYDGGPIFEVTRQGPEFTARDTMGSNRTYRAISLEGLVEAIGRHANGDAMLQWIRPVPWRAIKA